MGGILTTNYFCAVIGGAVRYFPLYNTKEFFENAVCFVFRVNHRTLYLPARTSPYTTYITTSLVTRVGSTNYYGIIQRSSWFQTGYLNISASWSYSSPYMVGQIIFTSTGNTIGLNYTYTIVPVDTGDSSMMGHGFITDTITVAAGESVRVEVNFPVSPRSMFYEYDSQHFEITCSASDTGTISTNTYNFCVQTSTSETCEFSLLES